MVSSSKVFRAVVLALRVALGAVFVYAAWTKLRQPIGPWLGWRARCHGRSC